MPFERSASARWLTVAAAVFVAGGIGLEVIRLPQEPYLGLSERGVRVALVRPGGPADLAGLRPGDELLSIGGRRTEDLSDPSSYLRDQTIGEPTPVVVKRDEAIRAVSLTPRNLPAVEVAWSLGHAAVALVFVLAGIVVFLQRRSALTAVFLALCLSLSVLLFKPYLPATEWGYRWSFLRLSLLSAALPALLLHFFLLFPFRRGWVRRRPRSPLALYAVSLVLVVLLEARIWPDRLTRGLSALIPMAEDRTQWVHWGETLVGLYWSVSLVVALGLFFHAYRTNRLATVRHRLRIAWLGALASILPLFVVLGIHLLRPEAAVPGDRLATLALVFLPISFGYAILRQQFVDWEWMVKRSLVYAALAHAAIFIFFASAFLTRRWIPEWTNADAPIGAVLGVLLLVGMLGPVSERLHDRLDRYVYPDRYDIRRPLRDLTRQIRRAQTVSRRERVLLATLGRVLGTQNAAFFRPRGEQWFEVSSFLGPRLESLPYLGPTLAEPIFVQKEPLLRGDLEASLAAHELPEGDLEILRALRARIFLPLIGPSGRLGLIILGRRSFGENYTTPELEFLEAFQTQASLALENATLREASRAPDEFREEMAHAQTVQRDLLPRYLPRLEHVQLAAISEPSRDVGGDYYDCWWRSENPRRNGRSPAPIDNGEPGDLILAIGDVSGKGVPAALLMSNVQAIFHAEAEVGRSPAQILHALNTRLCSLDRPDRFVSFFCARFDPATRTLEYANAGHLPPVWVRSDGSCAALERAGLLLGVRAQSEYTGGRVNLDPGDVLVLFTDGVTERDGEEGSFDEGHLARFVAAHRHLGADDLLSHILGRLDGRLAPSNGSEPEGSVLGPALRNTSGGNHMPFALPRTSPSSEALADDTTLMVLKLL